MVACLRRKSCTPFAAYAFIYLVGQGLALCLLLSTELNMLGSLHNLLMLRLADTAFHLDDKFLRYFCLSPQDGLGLPMVPTLLPLVSACTLSIKPFLRLLVLGNLVLGVLVTPPAISIALIWYVYLQLILQLTICGLKFLYNDSTFWKSWAALNLLPLDKSARGLF